MDTTAVLRPPSRRVDPRARVAWALGSLLGDLALIAAAWAVLAWTDWLDVRLWWVGLAVVLSVVVSVAVAQWRWRVHRWEVTDVAVYTQSGWWTREARIAPISRVQTVDYAETALGRALGLATVTVTTASAAGALEIAGLDRETARSLAEELTERADAVAGDAT